MLGTDGGDNKQSEGDNSDSEKEPEKSLMQVNNNIYVWRPAFSHLYSI